MSAFVSPVGGRAWMTLSILKIRTRRRYLIRSPVNGEVSGGFTGWLGAGDGVMTGSARGGDGGGDLWLMSTKAVPARMSNAIAEPTAAISARRVTRTPHHKGPRLPPATRGRARPRTARAGPERAALSPKRARLPPRPGFILGAERLVGRRRKAVGDRHPGQEPAVPGLVGDHARVGELARGQPAAAGHRAGTRQLHQVRRVVPADHHVPGRPGAARHAGPALVPDDGRHDQDEHHGTRAGKSALRAARVGELGHSSPPEGRKRACSYRYRLM